MKKIILISILISILVISLSSCGVKTITYPDGQGKIFSKQFTIVKNTHSFNSEGCYYIYDNNTKIMYLYVTGGNRAGLTPYYIIVDGKPTIAIYGVNYEYQE